MKESTLFKFALAVSLIGILALLIIVEKIDLPLNSINSIKNAEEESITHSFISYLFSIFSIKNAKEGEIKVKGTIEGIKETPGLFILNVKDETGNINVIVFKENNLNFTKNSLVEIEGTVQEYQGKNEVIAKRIIT